MYKTAAQMKIRFPSVRGDLTVEQLFSMPLTSVSGFDLDLVARGINTELKEMTEQSFVQESKEDPRRKRLEIALEIVKDVIKTKQEENAAELLKVRKAQERRKILDIITAKKDEALSAATLEELEKKLAELE